MFKIIFILATLNQVAVAETVKVLYHYPPLKEQFIAEIDKKSGYPPAAATILCDGRVSSWCSPERDSLGAYEVVGNSLRVNQVKKAEIDQAVAEKKLKEDGDRLDLLRIRDSLEDKGKAVSLEEVRAALLRLLPKR